MRIGILADIHEYAAELRRALAVLNADYRGGILTHTIPREKRRIPAVQPKLMLPDSRLPWSGYSAGRPVCALDFSWFLKP
jgi:hypothetical protein